MSRTNIDVVYCSTTVEIEIIKSAVSGHHTVQIVSSDYVEKAVLENPLNLEKLVFKIRDKLGRLMSQFYDLDCNLDFEKNPRSYI